MTLTAAGARLRAHARLKLALSGGLTLFFCVPYFTLQRLPVDARTLPLSPLDTAVPFQPDWTAVYQSVYLLLPAAALWADSADALRRYARGFVALSLFAFALFAVFPITGPRPEVPAHGLYALLVQYDTPRNSFPSLHVALAAYSVLFAHVVWVRPGASAAWIGTAAAVGFAWMAAVAYSTLATKQHYAVDLPPGLLMAFAAHRWAFSGHAPEETT
jgi:membrane-associated phospholipid phosphatase